MDVSNLPTWFWPRCRALYLLPAVEQEQKRYSILALAAGVLVAVGIVLSKE
jgi:hypothetical protein